MTNPNPTTTLSTTLSPTPSITEPNEVTTP